MNFKSSFTAISADAAADCNGGFIPVVIFGYVVAAETVAAVIGMTSAAVTYAVTH